MSWRGCFSKAGIDSDGKNVSIPNGTITARNYLPPYGTIWYVDKNESTSGGGRSWEDAFLTITEAVTAASNYDIIMVGPGFYTEAATITITQTGLKIIGLNSSSKTRGPSAMKTPTSAGPMLTIAVNANDVEIMNMSFIATSGQKGIQLGGATTGYVWRTHIHDCGFFGDGTGTYAIGNYGITTTPSAGAFPDVAECVVEDCFFYIWATAAIATYGTRVLNRRNTMYLYAGGVGIVLGAGRPYGVYSENLIEGTNSTDTGILITGGSEGDITILGNKINNVATPITLAKYTSWYDGNYFGLYDSLYHPNPSDLGKNKNGNVWYVDKSVSTTGDGKCWSSAFKTVTEAVSAIGNYDTIIIAPGFYTEVATQTITETGITIKGLNTSGKTRGPCALKGPSGGVTTPIITLAINANDIEICNLGFIATGAGKAIQLGDAATGYVWRTHIHDCSFFGDDVGTYGIGNYGITTTPAAGNFPDVAECVVENCHFYAWVSALAPYGTRVLMRNNTIFVPVNGNGIILGCGRPFVEVTHNKIIGKESGDTGILVTGNDDGSVLVFDNVMTNLGTDHTKAISDAGFVNNPGYGNSTTFTQIDPDT